MRSGLTGGVEETMRILIVDDERPARGELRFMLGQLASTADVLEARTAAEALALVAEGAAQQCPVDLIFLDINLPGGSGLGVAAELMEQPNPPLIVFATAYDAHALRAFELAAVDYLVKPISEQRLAHSIQRVRQLLGQKEQLAQQQQSMRSYLRSAPPGSTLQRLWLEQENGNGRLVAYAEILWITAEEKRVYAQTRGGERLEVRSTLKELEPRLAAHHFVRVHKAYLVNLEAVAEVVPWFSGAYLLRMNDAARSEIPLSRQYARVLKDLAG
jgi:DNA-binding LytR/AlgR family response regulator